MIPLLKLNPKVQKYINFALEGSVRMINMVTDLLEYSSHDSDQITTTEVDLNEVLRESIIDLGLNIEQSNTQINANELPIIKGNHSQLLRVFYNLISNSIKYKSPNLDPIINILYKKEFHSHVLSFEDNGRGFDQKDSLKIFQMFKRSGDLTNLSGSGIGLATVKKIVNNHYGRIFAESQLGHGSKFTLVFEIH
jgi:light-regulated signal transduction histidine kinase (bacteriophytochrome)